MRGIHKMFLVDWFSLAFLNGMMMIFYSAAPDAPWWTLVAAMEMTTLSWWKTMEEIDCEDRFRKV